VEDPSRSITPISPRRSYQKLVATIEGKPEERILSYLMLRSLNSAYSERMWANLRWRRPAHAFHFAIRPLSGSDRAPILAA